MTDYCKVCYKNKRDLHKIYSGDLICEDCLQKLNLSPESAKIYSISVPTIHPGPTFGLVQDISTFLMTLHDGGIEYLNACCTADSIKLKFRAVGEDINSIESALYKVLEKLNDKFPELKFESPYIEEKI